MKTAATHHTATEPTRLQQSLQYRPPQIEVCVPVIYYPTPGDKKNYTIAFVKKVGERALEVVTMEGRHFSQVRHVTDPRVTEARIAQAGAWDFGPTYHAQKKLEQYIEQSEGHFKHLDSEVTALWEELRKFQERFESLRKQMAAQTAAAPAAKSSTEGGETGSTKAAGGKKVAPQTS